jgi:quinoprotein glucose dehydrogenase
LNRGRDSIIGATLPDLDRFSPLRTDAIATRRAPPIATSRATLTRRALSGLLLLAALIATPSRLLAQQGTRDGEWPSYGGDLGSTRYSPLDRIDATNFGKLEVAWRWPSADGFLSKSEAGGEWWGTAEAVFAALQREDPDRWRAGRPPMIHNLKATPLMVGGVLYLNTPISQGAAVDAATGRTLWVYNPKSYESGTTTMSVIWNQRGVAYWSGAGEPQSEASPRAGARVFWGTGDGWLVCVDAATGRPCDGFGAGGRVDLMEGLPRARRGERDYLGALTYSVQSPPIVVRDVVITPASIADRRITKEAIPGWIRAWDVRTGALRWVFHTVPVEGEAAAATWKDESWRYSGNVNVWTAMSADEELGYLYLPLGTATNDFYGGHRRGDNLYSESLVCLDAETGERVWHFQFVHHGLWDYDLPAAPNLVDLTVGGRSVPAVAQVTKQGFTLVFDRRTGEPLWPIEERPVPAATMPGEEASPTQPYPTRPPPFEYHGVETDDLADFTPEIRRMALDATAPFELGQLYTPPSLAVDGGKQGTLMRPSTGGGANWFGAAIDPESGLLYVPSRNTYTVVSFYTPDPKEGGSLRYTHGGRGSFPRMPDDLPLFKPPYSRYTAIDLGRGELAWTRPLGEGSEWKKHPALQSLDLPPLGGDGFTGPLLTKALLIHGQDGPGEEGGPRLVARDKRTGEVVGEVRLPGRPLGTPMTYEVGGRQYIALTVSLQPVPELIALALPPAAEQAVSSTTNQPNRE